MKLIFLTLIFLILIPTPAIFGQSPELPAEKCSRTVYGVRYCTTTPFISLKSGATAAIDISIQNMTEKPVSIVHGSFYDYYRTEVTDSKGRRIPSAREILLKKHKTGTATPEEISRLLPIGSLPRIVVVAPREKYKVQFALNDFYEFKAGEKYLIKMKRKISKQYLRGEETRIIFPTPPRPPLRRPRHDIFELSFGTIEVEIN